jgi:hypothetical protein
MSESAKTFLFVGAAAAAVLAAVLTQPALFNAGPIDLRGKALFPDFKDPLAVADMKIVEYDEDNATIDRLEVKKELTRKGKLLWSIPSHEDYPADQSNQVGSAAAGLVGLKILGVASENQSDQKLYSVVDPTTAKPGDTGVGKNVTMLDKDGKTLLALVVGKEVADRPNQRYVRRVGQDPIYIAEIKTDPLSTKFENWIERNLLQINTIDMSGVQIRDYAIQQTREGLGIARRRKIDLDYNDTAEPKWKLSADEKFLTDERSPEGGRWAPVKLGPDEELDTAKLDDLRMALDDLKIVDVQRKPPGLSADLRVSRDFTNNRQSRADLEDKGFYAGQVGDGPVEMYSVDGEIRVGMKDGVQYVLRFGEIAGRGTATKDDKAKAKDKRPGKGEEKDKEKAAGLNRYLLVMAQFDPKLIPPPKLDPLPEWKPEAAAPAEKPKAAKPAAQPAAKAEEKKPESAEAKKPGDAKAEAKKPADTTPDGKKPEAAKPAAKDPPAKGKPAAEKKAEQKPAAKTKQQIEAEKKAVAAERARIEKENKRKQDEYDRAVADGKKRVGDLNARFADWYYIIAEDVYKKIHLSRDQIVKKKEKPKPSKDVKGPHAGHDHDELPSAPLDQLDKLKGEGPGGEK